MTEQKTNDSLLISRRRLLSLTAAGVTVATIGGLKGVDRAFAADKIRWVSPRGTIEVLDDYPYWVAKKFGYFGDIETTLEPGPADATATVKLVDQGQADMGYPSPGVFSLGLAQGIPLVSVFHMGGGDVFDNTLEPGWAPFTASGLAQWGPPATRDFFGLDAKSAGHELISMLTALRESNEFDIRRLIGRLKVPTS